MKISDNSWHFKLNALYDRNVIGYLKQDCNVTLCEYFWATVWSLICLVGSTVKWFGISIVLLMIFWFSIVNPLFTLIQLHSGWIVLGDYDLKIGLAMVFVDLLLITLLGILATKDGNINVFPKWLPIPKLWNWLCKKINHRVKTKKVDSEPNLVFEFIKAKKQKICPIIKLKEEN